MHVGRHSNWRTAAPTVFVVYFAAIHTNLRQDLTGLHTRPTHSPSKKFRLHSLNHLQEFRLKLLISFQELRLNSRLRAFGPRALRPSRLAPSRVLWFDTTYRALPHPGGFVPYPIPGLWFYVTYLLRYNTTQYMFLPCAGFNPTDFSFISFCSFALQPTCVMLSRYISNLVALDRMTRSAHSLLRVQTQITEFPPKNSDSTHSSLS